LFLHIDSPPPVNCRTDPPPYYLNRPGPFSYYYLQPISLSPAPNPREGRISGHEPCGKVSETLRNGSSTKGRIAKGRIIKGRMTKGRTIKR